MALRFFSPLDRAQKQEDLWFFSSECGIGSVYQEAINKKNTFGLWYFWSCVATLDDDNNMHVLIQGVTAP